MHFLSPDNLINPLARKQPEQTEQPPTDTDLIELALGTDAAEQFHGLLPHQEQENPPKADLPGGELALSEKEAAQAKAREQEQTLEHQARTWFLDLGKDEGWIEEHFTFEGGITCIAVTPDLSKCNIRELPSFFKEIKGIESLDLSENLLTTLHNIPKEMEGYLSLSENPNLASCAGLERVTVGGDLYLDYNPNLASCAGLERVTVGGNLWLRSNPNLTSLEGLPPKENIGGSLIFSRNQQRLIKEAKEKDYKIHIDTFV